MSEHQIVDLLSPQISIQMEDQPSDHRSENNSHIPSTPLKNSNIFIFDQVVTPRRKINFENIKNTPEHLKKILCDSEDDILLSSNSNSFHDENYDSQEVFLTDHCYPVTNSLYRSTSVKLQHNEINYNSLHPCDYSSKLCSSSIPNIDPICMRNNGIAATERLKVPTQSTGQSDHFVHHFHSNPENVLLHRNAEARLHKIFSVPSIPVETIDRLQKDASEDYRRKINFEGNDKYIGDYTREHILPFCMEKGCVLPHVKANVVSDMLNGHYSNQILDYIVVDCRYPYEYEGGHINNSINIFTEKDLQAYFIENAKSRLFKDSTLNSRLVLIFHCEFSQQRGPILAEMLRDIDRNIHKGCYPMLFYPEIYVLTGGYRTFYESYPNHCIPQSYIPMNDERFLTQCHWYKKQVDYTTISYTATGIKKKH